MWRYQATTSHGFQAIVFRPLDGSRTLYKVVGINDIPAGEINEPVSYNIPESNRIKVQRGDVIGWSLEVGAIPYDMTSDKHLRWIRGHNQYSSNDIVTFDHDGSREYSIEATVQVSISSNFKMFL